MKIIQLIYTLSSGGAEKFVVDLSNQLADMGHGVTLCMLLNDNDPKRIFNKQFLSKNVHFHSMNFEPGFSLGKVRKVCKYIQELTPDVVHCHLNVIPYIFPLALKNTGIRFIHTLHNIAEHASGTKIQYYMNRYFYRTGRIHPVCISRLCKESYEEFYKLTNAPCIDNGRADVELSVKSVEIRQEIENLKETTNSKVFLHVARCFPQKNQKLLIEAFNELDKQGIDFILLILGSHFDSEEGKRLQASACSRIYFLGEKNNVNDYMRYADAFCLTSVFEGLPISLLEALSCGVTPICTPVGGIPDVISDGQNGYLSAGLKTEEYVEAIHRFMKAPIPSEKLKDCFHNNYSMEICAEKYLKYYHEVDNA